MALLRKRLPQKSTHKLRLSLAFGSLEASMNINMYTWYYLEQVVSSENGISLRLLPDYIDLDLMEPVINIYIKNPYDLEAEIKLKRFETEPVCEIESSDEAVLLWSEYDDIPTKISGCEVIVANEPYSEKELKDIIILQKKELEVERQRCFSLNKKLSEANSFTLELIRRAEIKISQTSKNTGSLEAHISALKWLMEKIKNA